MMKRALLAATAMMASAVSAPAIAVPLPAADPDAPTQADMQLVCDSNYVNNQGDPSLWRASVIDASSSPTTPSAIAGTEHSINFRADTGSTFTLSDFLRAEDPLTRTGGSPNMWGQSVFGKKTWDNTLYDVEMLFSHNVTYNWTCHVEENVPTVVHHPGNGGGNGGDCGNSNGNNNGANLQTGGNGNGNNGCGNGNGGPNGSNENAGGGGSGGNGNNNGGNLQTGGNGNGNNGCGNGNGGPNGTNENCGGNGGGNEGWDETVWNWEFRSDNPETQTNTDIDDGYDTTATNLQQAGHVEGVNYDEYGTYRPAGVRTLACISPGKKGGSWTPKHGYVGGNCNTTTFNAAPTAYGREFDPISSNSLPPL